MLSTKYCGPDGSPGLKSIPTRENLRHDLTQQFKTFGGQINPDHGLAGNVSPRPGKRVDQLHTDRVVHEHENNRDGGSRLLGVWGSRIAHGHDRGNVQRRQLRRHLPESFGYLVRKAMFKSDVAPLDITKLLEALQERVEIRLFFARTAGVPEDAYRRDSARWLRARRERPRGSCAAEQRG